MDIGSRLRPPPRRRSARRIATVFCIALLALPLGPGRAEAYPCGTAAMSASAENCPAPRRAKPKQAGEPNIVSLALFVAVVVGVLVIPINYSRQRSQDRE